MAPPELLLMALLLKHPQSDSEGASPRVSGASMRLVLALLKFTRQPLWASAACFPRVSGVCRSAECR